MSNYIMTKSSVPVMVARKKLKKHTKKVSVRLTNNLGTAGIARKRRALKDADIEHNLYKKR